MIYDDRERKRSMSILQEICKHSPTLHSNRLLGHFWKVHLLHQIWLNIAKDGDFTASLGNLCLSSDIPPPASKFKWYFLGFSFCPLSLILSPWSAEKTLAPISLFLWAFSSTALTVPSFLGAPHMSDAPIC